MRKENTGYATGFAVGARLRRLTELFDRDARQVYEDAGVTFEQRWFGLLNQLVISEPMTVGEIAATLRISHASVSETRRSLENAGLISSEPDELDGRRRRLRRTHQGIALTKKLSDIWDAMEATARELDKEAKGVIGALDRLDAALDRSSLKERVLNKLNNR